MTTARLFDLAFLLAAPFWALMILAPGWRGTRRIAASPATVLPVLCVYLALAVPVLPELWAAVSSPDPEGFRRFTSLPAGGAAIWAQVIAWDLLVGQWMYLESRRLGTSPLVMGPLLLLTVLLSPVGLLLFLALRWFSSRSGGRTRAARASAPEPTDAPVGH
ncbi:ABA4-like family protein [Streptomyces sp. NPDC059637]|uniref:ABA4-like family protein n=1 Tax=Streptomyces sp. NPDC059637 TaxID=3347752 RepID=UPI0036BD3218